MSVFHDGGTCITNPESSHGHTSTVLRASRYHVALKNSVIKGYHFKIRPPFSLLNIDKEYTNIHDKRLAWFRYHLLETA